MVPDIWCSNRTPGRSCVPLTRGLRIPWGILCGPLRVSVFYFYFLFLIFILFFILPQLLFIYPTLPTQIHALCLPFSLFVSVSLITNKPNTETKPKLPSYHIKHQISGYLPCKKRAFLERILYPLKPRRVLSSQVCL